jgi:hypothetical protein
LNVLYPELEKSLLICLLDNESSSKNIDDFKILNSPLKIEYPRGAAANVTVQNGISPGKHC